MASDDFGDPVDGRTATVVLKELCANGYVEQHMGACRTVLPSLTPHFGDIRCNAPCNEVVQTVQTALNSRGDR